MDTNNIIIISISIILAILIICFSRIGIIAFNKTDKGGAKSYGLFFQRSLRLLAVIFVIYTLIVLSVSDKFQNEVYILLSGIVGYVLGGIPVEKDKNDD